MLRTLLLALAALPLAALSATNHIDAAAAAGYRPHTVHSRQSHDRRWRVGSIDRGVSEDSPDVDPTEAIDVSASSLPRVSTSTLPAVVHSDLRSPETRLHARTKSRGPPASIG